MWKFLSVVVLVIVVVVVVVNMQEVSETTTPAPTRNPSPLPVITPADLKLVASTSNDIIACPSKEGIEAVIDGMVASNTTQMNEAIFEHDCGVLGTRDVIHVLREETATGYKLAGQYKYISADKYGHPVLVDISKGENRTPSKKDLDEDGRYWVVNEVISDKDHHWKEDEVPAYVPPKSKPTIETRQEPDKLTHRVTGDYLLYCGTRNAMMWAASISLTEHDEETTLNMLSRQGCYFLNRDSRIHVIEDHESPRKYDGVHEFLKIEIIDEMGNEYSTPHWTITGFLLVYTDFLY